MIIQSEIFAANLRERRRRLGLTQKQLADLIGYSEKSVSKWESGNVIAPSAVLPLLAKHLGTSIDALMSSHNPDQYYLGIDGGGTKTEFAIADTDGNVISRALLEGCNPVDIGIDRTLDLLSRGIASVTSDIPCSCISVFAGISGGITGENKERIHDFLSRYNFKYAANGSDAENAVALALPEGDGTAVIMGTGSIAFTKIGNTMKRRGGYGYLIDDGGSGFAIGRDALIAALQAEDGRGEDTLLLPLIKKRLEVDELISSLGVIYAGGKRIVASIAPDVFEAYKRADKVAREILESNMKTVAGLIADAPICKNGKRRAVLVGGLTHESAILFPLIKRHLKCAGEYDITSSTKAPIYGALILAGAPIKKEIL